MKRSKKENIEEKSVNSAHIETAEHSSFFFFLFIVVDVVVVGMLKHSIV